jgi:hypothetical protein
MRDDAIGNKLPAASGQVVFEGKCSFDGAPGPDTWCSKRFRFSWHQRNTGFRSVEAEPQPFRILIVSRAGG